MSWTIAPLCVLLLALLHGPGDAQALVSPFLPEFLFSGNEPATLVLTGVALLGLARTSRRRP